MRSISKKFHGFLLPGQFVPRFEHAYKDRHASTLGSLVGLRQPAHVVSKPSKGKELYLERIVYVGCVHGGSEDIYDRLNALVKYPPHFLIFAGDISGSKEIEQLKKHFYDEKEGSPGSPYRKYTYFGDWAATLPMSRREALLSTLEKNARKILKIVNKIKKQGTQIYFLEGNWDNPHLSGIRTIASIDIKDVFDTQRFFKSYGCPFINHLTTLQTKTSLHIFFTLHYPS